VAHLPTVNVADELSCHFDRSVDDYMDLNLSTLVSLHQHMRHNEQRLVFEQDSSMKLMRRSQVRKNLFIGTSSKESMRFCEKTRSKGSTWEQTVRQHQENQKKTQTGLF